MTDPSPDIPWYKAYTGNTPQGRVLHLPHSITPSTNTHQLGDGREQFLLTHVRNLSPTTPSSVATAIDSFAFSNQYLMTIGPRKANLLISLITPRKPKIMLELGGYIGYPAVVLGAAVKAAGGEKYISVESNEVFASIAREMVSMAGLDGFVEVQVGRSDFLLRELAASASFASGEGLDFLFIDHYKPAYLHDLMLAEEIGLVREGTWVVADNVGHPGAPEYKAYVLCSVEEKKRRVQRGQREANPNARNWYLREGERGVEAEEESVVGRPELEYDTECLEAFEPDGYHHIDEVSWLRFQKMRQCLDILYKELIGICVDDER
ncbi:S-adenosyl-L-methionine-dependent methyltransferase [Aureobasidium pullulans]|uniref:catechol O-methyltransferase n=1 Tax=Aureobasidium pullulans TaxID=5580 RepID=A0A4S8S537_AURPU|nr:S-adenosyl-L-methionine-dependent methyltransferase [Aureobasidium pullulans]